MSAADIDLTASDVIWDLEPLLNGAESADDLMVEAKSLAETLASAKGKIATMTGAEFASLMTGIAEVNDLVSRAGHYGMLRFTENTLDPERGAARQKLEEASIEIGALLLFVELEFAALDDEVAQRFLDDEQLGFCHHHLVTTRLNRPHLLSEAEETILIETSTPRSSAWVRMFDEQTSAIELQLPENPVTGEGEIQSVGLEQGLSLLAHPDRVARKTAAEAVTDGLAPGLRTRAYIFNTILLEKSIEDRLRNFPTWVSSRNLANEATDESVEALVAAVVGRYDIPQRWYRLKARVLGVDRLADYDRMAAVADSQQAIGWAEATDVVRDAYRSFSPELADIVDRFINEGWIHAPTQPGKQPGAFCAYTVPSHHPYVLLNWTSKTRDIATLAHELGHGVHAYLSRGQGIFHHSTPLTLAETASVFGETVTNNRLLSMIDDPAERFALSAASVDDAMATVFRQVAMNRFENEVHTHRRNEGEISVDTFGDLWAKTQTDMMGDSVEITEGYKTWWSYIPHFMGTPGYVYAYAYGQLLALSVYARYEAQGPDFVPSYLELLSSGGSMPPAELGAIVDCDLNDPGFWSAGLDIVERQLDEAEQSAKAAGRIN